MEQVPEVFNVKAKEAIKEILCDLLLAAAAEALSETGEDQCHEQDQSQTFGTDGIHLHPPVFACASS